MQKLPTMKGTVHPGACRHSLEYDRKPVLYIGVWNRMWNTGSLSEKK